jgi:hypothetical protein
LLFLSPPARALGLLPCVRVGVGEEELVHGVEKGRFVSTLFRARAIELGRRASMGAAAARERRERKSRKMASNL